MRLEKAADIFRLALELAGDADGLTLDEIAEKFGVSRRTAERMRDAVESAFGPLDPVEEERKVRFRLTTRGLREFFNAPTAEELIELEMAARALETAQAPERAERLHGLRAKIAVSLRAADRRRLQIDVEDQMRVETFACQVGPRPMADGAVLSQLREALLRGVMVRFGYIGIKGEMKTHDLTPYGLLFGPRYYLIGGYPGRDGAFTFRLDHIHDLTLTERSAAPPPDFDLKAHALRSFGVYQEEPRDIELRFTPKAAREARTYLFHPTQQMIEEADGGLTVRFHAGAMVQIATHLMSWSDGVTIVAPDELRQIMRDRVMRLYLRHVAH